MLKFAFDQELIGVDEMYKIYSSMHNRKKLEFIQTLNENIQIDIVIDNKSSGGPYKKDDFKRCKLYQLIFIPQLYEDALRILKRERLSVDMKNSQ